MVLVGGSSPLTRGKHVELLLCLFELGLIPTHAGKTLSTPRSGIHRRAHPHSRGENVCVTCKRCPKLGSSPLTRGKHTQPDNLPLERGLIPAHARKTECKLDRCSACRAHPRSCEENTDQSLMSTSGKGSSPLTRGKLRLGGRLDAVVGLIPAHAGKTTCCRQAKPLEWAHPRSRGENKQLLVAAASQRGSSPLTRGKHHQEAERPNPHRLIPAHRRKTGSAGGRDRPRSAHPRSRGENCAHPVGQRYVLGSSPLTRGKRRSAPAH